jgi:hypothetical protein
MRVLHEADMSPSYINRLRDSEVRRTTRENYKKEKLKRWKEELKLRKKSEKRKSEYLKLQQERAIRNDEIRKQKEADAAANSTGGGEVISSKDSDATATAKGISNVAGVAGRLLGVGVRAAGKRMREKEAARKTGQKKAGEKAAETTAAMKQSTQRLLPPGRSGPNEITDKTSRRQPGTSRLPEPTPRPFTTSQRVRTSKRILPPGVNRASESPISKRPSSGLFNPNAPKVDTTPRPESLGQKARRNAKLRTKLIQNRMEEYEYSCWREEFLYELGELRQKTKNRNLDKDPVIDVMPPGKSNKITIEPNVSESTETAQAKIKMLKYTASQYSKVNEELNVASHMAKATPKITGRTGTLSDKYTSKQPGKYSAEFVRDQMKKMFAGGRNYQFDSNQTNIDADDNDVPNWSQYPSKDSTPTSSNESYDGHRHHSSGETTNVSNSSSEASARKNRATSAVLKAMASMNKDVEPRAKKKKKKKSEQ